VLYEISKEVKEMAYLDIWKLSEIFAVLKLAFFFKDNKCSKAQEMSALAIALDKVPDDMQGATDRALAAGEVIGAKVKTGRMIENKQGELVPEVRAINGAVERKIGNVSSLLIDAYGKGIPGFTYGYGYNYQFSMVDATAIHLGITTEYLLRRVNKGRAAMAERARKGEFSAKVNKKLIARGDATIKLSALENSVNELDLAEKENRKPVRAEMRRNQ